MQHALGNTPLVTMDLSQWARGLRICGILRRDRLPYWRPGFSPRLDAISAAKNLGVIERWPAAAQR